MYDLLSRKLYCRVKFSKKGEKMRKLSILFTLIITAVLLAGCGGHTQEEKEKLAYKLPQDHRMHQDKRYQTPQSMDWLYFTGKVTSNGDIYGYEVNIFQVWIEDIQSFGYRTDIAITDVSRQSYHASIIFSLASPIYHYDTQRKENVWEYNDEGVSIRHWESSDVWELSVNNAKSGDEYFAIDLILRNETMGYYPETDDGIIKMGRCKGGTIENMLGLSYYYTHPALTSKGTFVIGSSLIPVEGSTWFDHQWGNFNTCPSNWDWFSLRLDNGDKIMLFKFNEAGNPAQQIDELLTSTYMSADGTLEYRSGKGAFIATPLREYTSTVTGKTFRVDWKLETAYGIFYIRPFVDEQVIPSESAPYYEGLVEVRQNSENGPLVGTGYLETTIVH